MKPTVGRTVHYTSHGSPVLPDGSQRFASECRAAIVTEVPGRLPRTMDADDSLPNGTGGKWVVGLAVLNPTGFFFQQGVMIDESGKSGGSWHWPEPAEREPGDRPERY